MEIEWRLVTLLNLAMTLLTSSTEADKRCFECSDVPHPADCNLVTLCYDNDDCVVRQYVTTGGLILYSSGCQPKSRCTGKRRSVTNMARLAHRQTDEDILVCDECCDGELCNFEGCGITRTTDRGPLCFECDRLEDPGACRTVGECEQGQVCGLYRETGAAALYTAKCIAAHVCEALSKVHSGSGQCYECCTGDFCNDSCHPDTEITGNSTRSV